MFSILWIATGKILWKEMTSEQKRNYLFYLGWSFLLFAIVVLPWIKVQVLGNTSPSYGYSQALSLFFMIGSLTTLRLGLEYAKCRS
jgi:hypothetical protein